MSPIKAAIIGAGRPRNTEGATGYGIARHHAAGYAASPDCELVAVSDIKRENGEAFAKDFPGMKVYTDNREMLEAEKPDMVSICLWIDLHVPIGLECVEAGVKAIHCEKPIASTFGEARRFVEAAQKAGVQLTFNHQRRFGKVYVDAKRRIDADEIGEIVKMEAACADLLDWGTHWFDMLFKFVDQAPAESVFGQVGVETEKVIFGVRVEDQGLVHYRLKNGVECLMATGASMPVVGASIRLTGTKGVIEIGAGNDQKDKVPLRIRRDGDAAWETIDLGENLHGDMMFGRAMAEIIDCLKTGKKSELDGANALQAAELTFGAYESSRRRARVDLPLTIEDSPLLAMIEAGQIG